MNFHYNVVYVLTYESLEIIISAINLKQNTQFLSPVHHTEYFSPSSTNVLNYSPEVNSTYKGYWEGNRAKWQLLSE